MLGINSQSPSFKSIYKVTMPDINGIKDEKEKSVYADAIINTVVMGSNMSVAEPRISNDNTAVFYKIHDKNDKLFENGFKQIVDAYNKQFNMDIAQKVYYEKASEGEYQNAKAAN